MEACPWCRDVVLHWPSVLPISVPGSDRSPIIARLRFPPTVTGHVTPPPPPDITHNPPAGSAEVPASRRRAKTHQTEAEVATAWINCGREKSGFLRQFILGPPSCSKCNQKTDWMVQYDIAMWLVRWQPLIWCAFLKLCTQDFKTIYPVVCPVLKIITSSVRKFSCTLKSDKYMALEI